MPDVLPARELLLPVDGAELFVRIVGRGMPLIVLHGGPDYDHSYLLPEMDRLGTRVEVIYYDQRGRGRSAQKVRAENVDVVSEIADLDAVRRYLGRERVALLGHSWGCVLALEYATRHPDRVSHLLLVNAAPASHRDSLHMREARRAHMGAERWSELVALRGSGRYEEGDPDVEAAYHRLHFGVTLHDPGQLDEVVARLRRRTTQEGVRLAREIERWLYDQTWNRPEYDLLSRLSALRAPTLVVHGDRDFVPRECAERLAASIAGARFVVLEDCGHFAFLEQPEAFERHAFEESMKLADLASVELS